MEVEGVCDAVDRTIVGRVDDVDDIGPFHGESVSEGESCVHAPVADGLAAFEELELPADRPASGNAWLRIVPEVRAAALKAAARSGTSPNQGAEGALGKAAKTTVRPGPARRDLTAHVERSTIGLREPWRSGPGSHRARRICNPKSAIQIHDLQLCYRFRYENASQGTWQFRPSFPRIPHLSATRRV